MLIVLGYSIASPSVASTREELLARLRTVAVPAGAVNDMAEVFNQPQAQELLMQPSSDPPGKCEGKVSAVGVRQVAFRRSDGPEQYARLDRPPCYAEHTHSVLQEHLGLSSEDIAALELEGAVECN